MSMNKYISGIIHCLDTVPSLKKALVKAFGGVDTALQGKQDVIKSASFSGTTSAGGNIKVLNGKHIIVGFTISDYDYVVLNAYNDGTNMYAHCTKTGASYEVLASNPLSGTVYYIE